jgi:hypothetical protein
MILKNKLVMKIRIGKEGGNMKFNRRISVDLRCNKSSNKRRSLWKMSSIGM